MSKDIIEQQMHFFIPRIILRIEVDFWMFRNDITNRSSCACEKAFEGSPPRLSVSMRPNPLVLVYLVTILGLLSSLGSFACSLSNREVPAWVLARFPGRHP